MGRITILLMVPLVVVCSGCSSETSEDEERAGPSLPSFDGRNWDDLSAAERPQFMRAVVLPAMKEKFNDFDPERFNDVGCDTCHGNSVSRGDFEMPGDIPPIDLANLPDDPIVDFMKNDVVPSMAELLGQPTFDPATGEGVGCLTCHERDQ